MTCDDVQKFVYAYLDGEFDEKEVYLFDCHMAQCLNCKRIVEAERQFQTLLQTKLREYPVDTSLLRENIFENLREAELSSGRRDLFLFKLAPAFAVMLIIMGIVFWKTQIFSPSNPRMALTEEAIQKHQYEFPDEVKGLKKIRTFFKKNLNLPVLFPIPPQHSEGLGARIVEYRGKPAAYMTYTVNGQKVSVIGLNSKAQGIPLPKRYRIINNRPIYLDHSNGYNVAIIPNGDNYWTITSPMPESQLIKMISW